VLLKFANESTDTLESYEAEKGIFNRLLPIGLAAMKLYSAQRGTGDVGPTIMRADGETLPWEQPLRRRNSFSIFGTLKVARTRYRTPGEPRIFPLDAQINLARGREKAAVKEGAQERLLRCASRIDSWARGWDCRRSDHWVPTAGGCAARPISRSKGKCILSIMMRRFDC
jgi:hypothetical protein